MARYIKISTDFGFAGTDDERIIKVSDDADLSTIESDELSEMTAQLTCTVEEIDEDYLFDNDIEIDEDCT